MLDSERKVFKRLCTEYHQLINSLLNSKVPHKLQKCTRTSKEALEQGNTLFKQKKHDDQLHAKILQYYCKSVAFALPDSDQLLSAYMNRSAFLLHICKFQESLTDIERALGLCKDNELQKGKLLCRKLECLRKMNSDDHECILKEVEVLIETMKSEKNKLHIESLIDKMKKIPFENKPKLIGEQEKILNFPMNRIRASPDSIAIKYNSKYGRHLVAMKDFNPGQVIFMDKAYTTMMHLDKKYTHCNNCLVMTWSGIPCEHCTWASFCSESCKSEAWEKFHEIECSYIPDALEIYNENEDFQHFIHIFMRMLTIGLKRAGGIHNLKADLESRFKLGDTSAEVFCQDGFVIEYSLADVIVLMSKPDPYRYTHFDGPLYLFMAFLWAFFVRESPFFGKFKNVVEMTNNDEALFVGSLLIRLLNTRPQCLDTYNDYDQFIVKQSSTEGDRLPGKETNLYSSPLNSLINHSCYPNIARCFTKYGEGIIYALQPIKKGSQIFVTYTGSFYQVAKSHRQPLITRRKMICDCSACSNDWPVLLGPNLTAQMNDESLLAMNKHGLGGVKEISETLTAAMKHVEQPSMVLCYLMEALQKKFYEIYVPKKEKLFTCKRQST